MLIAQHIPCSGETKLRCLCLCHTVLRKSLRGKGGPCSTKKTFIFCRPAFITTDGLYRICGAHSDVQMIKQEIDKVFPFFLSPNPLSNSLSLWPQGNFEILSTIESVHALTSALKLFFRQLPEPVIPWQVLNLSLPTFRFPFRMLESCWK